MDKSLRNTLRNTVTHCRRLLEEAIAELLQGQFGIHFDGKIEDAASLSHLSEEDREYRAQILVHLAHIGAGGQGSRGAGAKKTISNLQYPDGHTSPISREAVAQLIREVAFTHLNRLAAYKMMETRGLIRESVSRGVKSQGFLFYLADHPEDEKLWSSGQQERAYRHFLTWLGGTLSQEIGVLFSPDDPANRLLPPQRVLDGVLDLLNSADLATIWAEDETIGWIYQYFTPKELRDQARSESQAPRNSYELAFRNQFYTPRYVVQFLTDNTLGRIWYEMRRGETRLAEKCEYLVRRPNEVFLQAGDAKRGSGGAEETNGESANGEIVNRKSEIVNPVYIPYRAKKDPRDLKILDPASGSGHFLLYCFDLLEIIYEEAYADPDLGPALQADYPTLADLRQAIPALILRHNLHGIDIDPRAVQIASLALWLKAKKSLSPGQSLISNLQSPISKMNIVCAEPMPGNAALLDEFTAGLQPPLLGQLLRAIVGKMELAGEAGSLLKIEEEIDDALAAAKKQWLAGPKPEQLSFFPQEKKPEQLNMFDLSGISDEQFWDEAEGRLLAALHDYAEHASGEAGLARRLFADDTARGFAFIDLCRQHFDVVLMNPPFGALNQSSKVYVTDNYPDSKNDILGTFVERGAKLLNPKGMLGAITSRTPLFLSSMEKWRKETLFSTAPLVLFADLGEGVLDSAMVKTAAYVLSRYFADVNPIVFYDLSSTESKGSLLEKLLNQKEVAQTNSHPLYKVWKNEFEAIPGSPLPYWSSSKLRSCFVKFESLANQNVQVKQGLGTTDDFRFVRASWEVSPRNVGEGKRWYPYAKGGESQLFYSDIHLVVNWEDGGREVYEKTGVPYGGAGAPVRNPSFYLRSGLTYTSYTNKGFRPRVLPEGCIFTTAGMAIFSQQPLALLALLNSSVVQSLLSMITDNRKWEVGYVQALPIPEITSTLEEDLKETAVQCWNTLRSLDFFDETTHWFVSCFNTPLSSLKSILYSYGQNLNSTSNLIEQNLKFINQKALAAYDLTNADILLRSVDQFESGQNENENEETDEYIFSIHSILSYTLGCVIGRWDIRISLDPALASTLSNPFDPLSVCSPGMLVGPDGLAAASSRIVSEGWLRARPNAISLPPEGSVSRPTIPDSEYPLAVDWDGILVDDPDHPDDLLRRVREVIEVLWGGEEAGRRGGERRVFASRLTSHAGGNRAGSLRNSGGA